MPPLPLSVLHARGEVRPEDLVRLYHRTELHWTRNLAEELPLDVGVAFFNKDLPGVWDANRVLDAAVPEGTSPEDAVAEVERTFAGEGAACRAWVMNPSAPSARTAPLAARLLSQGWEADPVDVLHLAAAPRAREEGEGGAAGLTIIPARASFRHARQLAEESAGRWGEPQVAEADMLQLDDPHWDALLAIENGAAAGRAGVLAVGDVGRIDGVYVAAAHRRRGVGRADGGCWNRVPDRSSATSCWAARRGMNRPKPCTGSSGSARSGRSFRTERGLLRRATPAPAGG